MISIRKRKDLTGQIFGRLTVVERADDYIEKNGHRHPVWKCKCSCGNEITVRESSLTYGYTKSCGCYRDEKVGSIARVHGGYGERLNYIWNSMVQRCCNKNSQAYNNYGGRGITLCDEWRDDYATFKKWALENGYEENLTLDRIDNNSGYSPENCRWTTMKEQSRNKRTNIYYTYNGETMCLSAWCDKLDLNYRTIWNRIRKKGIPFEEAIAM